MFRRELDRRPAGEGGSDELLAERDQARTEATEVPRGLDGGTTKSAWVRRALEVVVVAQDRAEEELKVAEVARETAFTVHEEMEAAHDTAQAEG